MGFGGISLSSLLIILVIVLVLFGTKRLKNIGSDLGEAMGSFRKGLNEDEKKSDDKIAGGDLKDDHEKK